LQEGMSKKNWGKRERKEVVVVEEEDQRGGSFK
jgi:hypothetical protein